MPADRPGPSVSGGCQCGAVRYRLASPPRTAILCHCRMCQKASGGPFMAFAGSKASDLVFTRGAPAKFSSSELAERGFCAACGTPLTYQMKGRSRISVTLCSLDDPASCTPSEELGVESRLGWIAALTALPQQRTEQWLAAADIADIGANQHPDRDT